MFFIGKEFCFHYLVWVWVVFVILCTQANSVEESHSWEGNSYLANQEKCCLKKPVDSLLYALAPNLSQINPVHNFSH
jgi:hypothetical protein